MTTAMQVETCFQAKFGNHGRACPFRVDIGLLFPVSVWISIVFVKLFSAFNMWKQNLFTFALYGFILFNAASVLKRKYLIYKAIYL